MFSKTLATLQEKYADILKGETITDFISVMHNLKACNLLKTETRLICIKDDINGIESIFKMQLDSIQKVTLGFSSIKVVYPRSPEQKLSFMGMNKKKNMEFAQSLPKVQKPDDITQKQGFMILGGGALLIGVIATVNILNPASYNYAPLKAQQECQERLKRAFPGHLKLKESNWIPDGDRFTQTTLFSTEKSNIIKSFECHADKDENFLGADF